MIGKIPKPGKSFGGCVKYNVLKKDAAILYAEGVRKGNIEQTIRDFNMQRKMNPGLGQAVGHIALSWSVNDLDKLNDELMVEIASAYLQKMKVQDTQVLMVRHHDRNHPHLHLVYNRVDNQGKTLSDRFQRQNNIKVCRELTEKYGFYIAPNKENVNRQQLRGEDKVKYNLFDAIKFAKNQVSSMKELKIVLKQKGIDMQYKYKSGSREIQGISFSKDGYKFKGSEIDRSLSYGKLSRAIADRIQEEKEQQQQQYTQEQRKEWQQKQDQPPSKGELKALADQIREAMKENQDSRQPVIPDNSQASQYNETVHEEDSTLKTVITGGMGLLEEMLGNIEAEPDFPGKKKKKSQQQGEEKYRGPGR
ncbi:relaxase/mobilization nuclease domain-containing protein [uncultured Mucilaginibacter sp.]|uniref:relaxase/mobilization nuclease domain-containing protein n=1 Tax=uncultured Mucilaginibacter sp. TaxID=797541 RepID=UPI00261C8830|nr:relaxase/mobilization nuclease domain-containing protein [uncultured Mucilaginibacter sp.]